MLTGPTEQYRAHWRCERCEHEFATVASLRQEAVPEIPKCPDCGANWSFFLKLETGGDGKNTTAWADAS